MIKDFFLSWVFFVWFIVLLILEVIFLIEINFLVLVWICVDVELELLFLLFLFWMIFLILFSNLFIGVNNWEKLLVFLDELVCNFWDVFDIVLVLVKIFFFVRFLVVFVLDFLVILFKFEVILDDSNLDLVFFGLILLINFLVVIFFGFWVEVFVDFVKFNFGVNVVLEIVVDFFWILFWVFFWVDILVCFVIGVIWWCKIKFFEIN